LCRRGERRCKIGGAGIDLLPILETLRGKRPVFHSEADFQFALAWEIQLAYRQAELRLEYPPAHDPGKRIDIFVRMDGCAYPIELKYAQKKLEVTYAGEDYCLKNHGAQDLTAYDFVKDICRVEEFAGQLPGFQCGYVIWLTNDPYLWREPTTPAAGYAQFSVHSGAVKQGCMAWGESMGIGTTKGRGPLALRGSYPIIWNKYSNFDVRDGLFRYALMHVEAVRNNTC